MIICHSGRINMFPCVSRSQQWIISLDMSVAVVRPWLITISSISIISIGSCQPRHFETLTIAPKTIVKSITILSAKIGTVNLLHGWSCQIHPNPQYIPDVRTKASHGGGSKVQIWKFPKMGVRPNHPILGVPTRVPQFQETSKSSVVVPQEPSSLSC